MYVYCFVLICLLQGVELLVEQSLCNLGHSAVLVVGTIDAVQCLLQLLLEDVLGYS